MTSLVKNGKYFGHVTITSGHKDQPMDTADSQWANCTTWWQLINYKVQILHWSIPSFIFCPSPPTSNLPSIWTFEVFKSYPPSPPPQNCIQKPHSIFLEKGKISSSDLLHLTTPCTSMTVKSLWVAWRRRGKREVEALNCWPITVWARG